MEIFVSISSIMPKPLRSTTQMACTSPNPRTYRMFRFPMTIPDGSGGRRRGDSGSMCRRPAQWGIFGKCKWHPRRKQKDKNVRMKNPRIGFRRIYGRHFSLAHILSSGRRQSQRVAVSNITSCLVRGKQTKAFILLRFYL